MLPHHPATDSCPRRRIEERDIFEYKYLLQQSSLGHFCQFTQTELLLQLFVFILQYVSIC